MTSDYMGWKSDLHREWTSFVLGQADWKLFLTITWADFLTPEMVKKKMRSLIQVMNRDLFGNNYTRIVGHSYFSYVYCLEHQQRGALHVHWLVDRPVYFDLMHGAVKQWDAFLYGERVKGIEQVAYVTKYVTKGGDLEIYKPKVDKLPSFVPMWYMRACRSLDISLPVPDGR